MAEVVPNRWLGLLALLLPGTTALAQGPLPPGGGLRGEYYEGTNFEKFVLARRDATINFNWGQQPPAPGLPAEQFSVRWTGWLVPPASGNYLFHVTVDDGVRLWLNDRLMLDEWRGQPLSNYTAAVELRAGEPYRLRVDYCQYGLDTRVFVTWERPDAQAAEAASSWRNLWGMLAEAPRPEPIPTSFLYTSNPQPAVAPAPLTTSMLSQANGNCPAARNNCRTTKYAGPAAPAAGRRPGRHGGPGWHPWPSRRSRSRSRRCC